MSTLEADHDALLLDLDGTVYRGEDAVEHAVDVLDRCTARPVYVTNNASRAPGEVAEHLGRLGVAVTAEDVVTSAQAGARVLAQRLQPGSQVLVIGAEALTAEVRASDLQPVREHGPDVAAVVQGHSPETGWRVLAEATLAIRAGALWVATNVDATLAVERGIVPGNGAMVAAVRTATGAEPLVAGKPARPLLDDAVARASSRAPLVVGDRLDTDVAGAVAIGAPCLFVLTGVHTAADLLAAAPDQRPSHVAQDLRGLLRPAADSEVVGTSGWSVRWDGDVLVVAGDSEDDETLGALRAACAVAWQRSGGARTVRAEGAGARAAVRSWGVVEG